MKRKKKYDKSVYKSFALISQFGINMLVPIGLMTWLGIYLDGKLGTSYWMIILFLWVPLQVDAMFTRCPSAYTDRVLRQRRRQRMIEKLRKINRALLELCLGIIF